MGILSTFVRSWKKSSRLRRLQLKIAPPHQTVDDVVAVFMQNLHSGNSEQEKALEEFLDLCEDDNGIRKLMEIESLSRSDLKEIYHRLCRAGLGQWIKGHYAALSTIAYGEPLLFLVRAEKAGMNLREIASVLLRYWSNEIPQGGLLRAVT
ncbi:MAG: hypothetical protein HY203_04345 [Nitrospirae bacterium]|nr:hypothetical protein [Nitrospirota bacterium]